MIATLAFVAGLAGGYFARPYIDQMVAAYEDWRRSRKTDTQPKA